MRIVDAYCGVGPWAARNHILPYTPSEILAIMDYCGIDAALVFSNLAHSSAWAPDANRLALEAAEACKRFVPAFLLAPHPYDDSLKPADYADAMRKAGAKAAWLRPGPQQHGVSTWLTADLLAMCTDHVIPLFLPADGVAPDQIDGICCDFPDLRLVLTDLSYRVDGWLYPLLRRHQELRVCLGPTYIPPLGPDRFVRHFGSERLIFGSGLPHFSPGGLIGHIAYSRLSGQDKQKVLADNIETLMKEVQL